MITLSAEKKTALRRLFSSLFFILLAVGTITAQQRLRVDITTRQLANHKIVRIERTLFYTAGGQMTVRYSHPTRYYVKTNSLGEVVIYQPEVNEVVMMHDNTLLNQSEALSHFISPDRANLDLLRSGYALTKSEKEGSRIVKTYIPTLAEDKKSISRAIVVIDGGQPIYFALYDINGTLVRKTYYENYTTTPIVTFPSRITQIDYTAKGDSVIRREEYHNLRSGVIDDRDWFDFTVPANAKRVQPFDIK